MKYIIVDNISPVIFSEAIEHNKVKVEGKVTSAGFVNLSLEEKIPWGVSKIPCPINGSREFEIKAQAYGESQSLHMESKREDSMLISLLLNRSKIV